MMKCEAFSASVCDRTLEQRLTSSQVGGGCGEDIDVDGSVMDSILAMAESRVGSLVTEFQDLSSCWLMNLRR